MPSNPLIKNTLLSMITFLKHKAEEKQLKPVITVAKLIDMLKSSGLNITYQQLAELAQDPTIAPSIKSINNNQVELTLGNEGSPDEDFNPDDFSFDENGEGDNSPDQQAPEDEEMPERENTVSNMAKRALARS